MSGLFTPFTDSVPTQPDRPEFASAGLRWRHCGCGGPRLFRIRRSLWMRILAHLRLYQCACCGRRVLRRPLSSSSAYAMRAYMPRYERR